MYTFRDKAGRLWHISGRPALRWHLRILKKLGRL